MDAFSQVSHTHEHKFFTKQSIIHEGLVNMVEEVKKELMLLSIIKMTVYLM